MKLLRLVCLIVGIVSIASIATPLCAAGKTITIIHTNDLHSHLLGFSPNIDYTPLETGDDATVGGWARIAGVIKKVKRNRTNPVLVLDAGDFLMGSLFHMLSREEAFELRLMGEMGYDVVTLGNHEFDLKPAGLARILMAAELSGRIPSIVLSNAVFSRESAADDDLERVFARGVVRPYRVIEKDGIRIGLFGLMGRDAAEVAPFASPVTFEDPVTTARRMVERLRGEEKAEIVICLSHSGLADDPERSEDEILAGEVPGIDIIISGHTHTKTDLRMVNDTMIVQAWSYGRQVGVIDVTWDGGRVSLKNYRLVDINDSIRGDARIAGMIDAFESRIDEEFLAGKGLGFRQIIAHTPFTLAIREDECNLGNLIADSIPWYINRQDSDPNDQTDRVEVGVISNGVIRDAIEPGKTGDITVCDAFRSIPLGIGFDDRSSMGYPLISFYIFPTELKKALEILTSIYPLKGPDYYLQISGVKFSYNPHRMIFDRVTEVWLGDEQRGYARLDYSVSNKRLIRVAADIYNATFLKVVGNFTWHVLDIVPKDRDGNPILDLKTVRVDADKQTPGIQELKEYRGVLEYVRSFPDTTGDGVPDVPDRYRGRLDRQLVEASWNPLRLLKRGTYVTWIAFGALITIFLILILITGLVRRILRRS
ncbi:MAG: bifunctional metallophosphatase/5'-nucleotidase [Deltaproteobacteria bacterium]|nr:bifunctional metallophosphatase/5'-nucleotidase [Deltaproteobacteria bacterium]